ncbi:MAG: hypothetical protein ACREEM_40980 [Blastocatellia bacterium]
MQDIGSAGKVSTSRKGLLPEPGFTWELFFIVILSLVVLGAIAVFFILLANGKDPGLLLNVATLILLLLALKLTPWLSDKYRARQRLALLSAEQTMAIDTRPPVLYLRSFKDDETIARAVGFNSIEQEMRLVLSEIGPFIAIAEPHKEPPAPGAARLYPQGRWQDEVIKEMTRARLVVLRIGDTKGFWWEVQEAADRVEPYRLVFLVPEGKGRYEKFHQRAREMLCCQLPEYKNGRSPFDSHGGILYFEPDGTPHLRKFKIVWLRQTFWNLFAAVLKIGLRPVYEQLGVKWSKPPVQPIQVLYMMVLVLLLGLVVYLAYALFNAIRLVL